MEMPNETSILKKLTLGIILPKKKYSKDLNNFMNWCLENPHIEIKCIVSLPLESYKTKISLYGRNILWKIILSLESFFSIAFYRKNNATLKNYNDLEKVKKISVDSPSSQNIKQLKSIKECSLDLLVAFELNDCCEYLKDLSKLGLLGFHHAEHAEKSNYPIYFEEVIKKKNKTNFTIIQMMPKVQDARLITRGSFITHGLFLSNRKNVMLRRNFYMQKILMEIYQDKNINGELFNLNDISYKLKTPYISDQFRYLIHILELAKKRVLNIMLNKKDSWNVGINFLGWKIFDIEKSTVLKNPKNHYLADPFIVNKGSESYCFVEDYDWSKSKGTIAAYKITNQVPKRLGIVLEEPFHLSFPFIFNYKSKHYMLPESADNMDIRIYESIEFPLKWKLKTIVKENVLAADSMIFEYNKLWWLFSNINPIGERDCCSELSIFYADNPIDGKWRPHENNPVIFDPSSARNGGIVFQNNSIYRVGQNQAFGTYGGGGISVNEIIDLTPNSYQEKSILNISPSLHSGIRGAHHLHSEGKIAVFDFLE